jgi:hypothetical protein
MNSITSGLVRVRLVMESMDSITSALVMVRSGYEYMDSITRGLVMVRSGYGIYGFHNQWSCQGEIRLWNLWIP